MNSVWHLEWANGAFELGCRVSLAPNPISARGVATAVTLDPAQPLEIAYRFEVLDPR
ncbi:hypothetical protein G3N57_27435 [Paraburkholderia sp. Se-20369]|nr:hypothetical protein [Paraburkholderia sp. Se-20369]